MKNKRFTWIKKLAITLVSMYVLACTLLYFFQEKLLFHPEKISKSVQYTYNDSNFKETFYEVEKGVEINSLLFSTDSISDPNRKLVFFIHGNGGTLKTLGGTAKTFTNRGYDCFMYDYRGYGKSDGTIDSEAKLFSDAQVLYDEMKKIYAEKDIVIVGYSIGTGIASWLASENSPKQLILEAPYYSMTNMMREKYPIVPTFLLRYPLESFKYISKTNCPIEIFHGDNDKTIPISNSQKLSKLKKETTFFISLEGVGHSGFSENARYQSEMTRILAK